MVGVTTLLTVLDFSPRCFMWESMKEERWFEERADAPGRPVGKERRRLL